MDGLNAAGVRKSLLYDMIGASLKATRGEHAEIRRAKVSEYLYDHIDMVVHPYEKLIGSQLGLYPVDDSLPDYAQRKEQVRAYLRAYREKRLAGQAPVSYTHLDVYKRQSTIRRFVIWMVWISAWRARRSAR